MPHKKTVDRKDGPADLVPTLRVLAYELGVSDDTVTQWRRRGLCVGGSGGWSITGTYLAARKAGLKPRLPDDADLVALIQEGMISVREEQARKRSAIDGEDEFELPGKSAYDPLFKHQPLRNRADAITREALIGEELKNKELDRKHAVERGDLVTKEESARAAATVRDAFIGLGKQLWTKLDGKLGDMPNSTKQTVAVALQQSWDELLAAVAV